MTPIIKMAGCDTDKDHDHGTIIMIKMVGIDTKDKDPWPSLTKAPMILMVGCDANNKDM